MKKNKILLGMIIGLLLSFSYVAFAYTLFEKENSWTIGRDWMWFKKISGDDLVRGNVEVPVEDPNIANKAYVDTVFGASGGGSNTVSTCVTTECKDTCGAVCCYPGNSSNGMPICRFFPAGQL